jgi:DNA repair protein RadA/Sms
MTQGVDQNRVALMIAMLEKRAGLQLLGDDVFVNIAGGLEVDEPAVDLGLVTAIASSFRNQPIDPHTAVFGEVGLTGEVRGATSGIGARPRSAGAWLQEDRDARIEYCRVGKAPGPAGRRCALS